jgi:hypothetical protein
MSKRPVPIDRLLQWAYRDELPKGYRGDERLAIEPPKISPMFKYAQHGGRVDNWSREPGFPLAMGTEPHPDAIAIHNAVMDLEDEVRISWPAASPVLLGELERLITPEDVQELHKIKEQPQGLVTLHARMGNRPPWHIDYSVTKIIGKERNSPLRKGRARRSKNLLGELVLSPPAHVIAQARFEYLAWHRSICRVASMLEDVLIEHTPQLPEAPQLPWYDGEGGRIILSDSRWMTARELASGRASALRTLPLKPQRERVLPPEKRLKGGPVTHMKLK